MTEAQKRNAEKCKAYRQRKRATDPNYVRKEAERVRAWEAANPERVKERHEKRMAIIRAGTVTSQDIADQYAVQDGKCYYCKAALLNASGEVLFQVDHKLPISRGGLHIPENICCACPSCNLRKHAKTEEQFLTELRSLN